VDQEITKAVLSEPEDPEEDEVSLNPEQVRGRGDKKQFDFFFLRTCFRTMDEFYKEKF